MKALGSWALKNAVPLIVGFAAGALVTGFWRDLTGVFG